MDEEEFYANDENELCQIKDIPFEMNFMLSDRNPEQHRNFLVEKFSLEKRNTQPLQIKKFLFKSKCVHSSEEHEHDKQNQQQNSIEVSKLLSQSALKSSTTSATFGMKKSVNIVDSIGRNLEEVRLFMDEADFIDNHTEFDDDLLPQPRRRAHTISAPSLAAKNVIKTAQQQQHQLSMRFPSHNKQEVLKIVEAQNVCIESMICTRMVISGLIQVRLGYTLDCWQTYVEMPCTFSLSNGNRDTFCFSFCLPLDLPVGMSCEICARYSAAGLEFWDNNNGKNYKLVCCALSPAATRDVFDTSSVIHTNSPIFMGVL